MCRQGLLDPVYKTGRGPKHFRVSEIVAVEAVLRGKTDVTSLAITATRALAAAKMNEQKIYELYRLLGLERKVLDTTEEEVLSLYEQALHLSDTDRQPTIEELEDWAPTLFAIDESFLGLVKKYTSSEEPWAVFLGLANKWANDRPNAFFETMPELRAAYDHLEAARKHIRVVSYMYCRQFHGVTTANNIFGTGSPTDKLLDLLSN